MVLRHRDWQVRMDIYGPGTPQERRQLGVAISEMVSKTFSIFEASSWISQPEGYWANIERDELRGLKPGRGPNLEAEAGRIGFEIRMERLKLGWSQEELARRAGLSRAHLGKIEQGKFSISSTVLLKIRSALQCPTDHARSRIGESGECPPKKVLPFKKPSDKPGS